MRNGRQPFALPHTPFSSAMGFGDWLLLWAQLRFGLGAAAEFTMCVPQSVEHLAGDSDFNFYIHYPFTEEKEWVMLVPSAHSRDFVQNYTTHTVHYVLITLLLYRVRPCEKILMTPYYFIVLSAVSCRPEMFKPGANAHCCQPQPSPTLCPE